MSELTKRPGQLAAVGAIHAADLTQDERLLLASYRATCEAAQGYCLDMAVYVADHQPRHIRPALKFIAGGAA
ncbi:hypothetical protein [Massilia scottii]|uniref:hypothetical protein n=1 Tax=Massilia scottii TaxID=3057166 RepID=UPI0006BB8225|nr:hypothetical protein [Massilia sp. CCM 9029]MDQ1834092.1 hypothetical protein [Massilia sp. CCM 9029]CUI04700.1 hypothetical protein BN2497_4177 [Janthinobacterium sp. CG23_2]CUU28486.1 hypothetical protein BN3177_4177 [Janthinobacterium sp. CG23_2]